MMNDGSLLPRRKQLRRTRPAVPAAAPRDRMSLEAIVRQSDRQRSASVESAHDDLLFRISQGRTVWAEERRHRSPRPEAASPSRRHTPTRADRSVPNGHHWNASTAATGYGSSPRTPPVHHDPDLSPIRAASDSAAMGSSVVMALRASPTAKSRATLRYVECVEEELATLRAKQVELCELLWATAAEKAAACLCADEAEARDAGRLEERDGRDVLMRWFHSSVWMLQRSQIDTIRREKALVDDAQTRSAAQTARLEARVVELQREKEAVLTARGSNGVPVAAQHDASHAGALSAATIAAVVSEAVGQHLRAARTLPDALEKHAARMGALVEGLERRLEQHAPKTSHSAPSAGLDLQTVRRVLAEEIGRVPQAPPTDLTALSAAVQAVSQRLPELQESVAGAQRAVAASEGRITAAIAASAAPREVQAPGLSAQGDPRWEGVRDEVAALAAKIDNMAASVLGLASRPAVGGMSAADAARLSSIEGLVRSLHASPSRDADDGAEQVRGAHRQFRALVESARRWWEASHTLAADAAHARVVHMLEAVTTLRAASPQLMRAAKEVRPSEGKALLPAPLSVKEVTQPRQWNFDDDPFADKPIDSTLTSTAPTLLSKTQPGTATAVAARKEKEKEKDPPPAKPSNAFDESSSSESDTEADRSSTDSVDLELGSSLSSPPSSEPKKYSSPLSDHPLGRRGSGFESGSFALADSFGTLRDRSSSSFRTAPSVKATTTATTATTAAATKKKVLPTW